MDTKQLMEWSAKYHTPNYGRTPLVLVRGEGSRVWDSDGKEYLDFTSGIAVTSLGHCHPVVTGAIREAAATLLHVSNIFHNAPQIHLAKMLIEHSFADRVFFCNSGAEANEAALKVVRKYAKENAGHRPLRGHRHPQLVPRAHAGHRQRHRPAEVPARLRAADAGLQARPVQRPARHGARDGQPHRGHPGGADPGRGRRVRPRRRLPGGPAQALRRVRRAAGVRRGPDRRRPHRAAVGLRALGRGARRDDARQGAGQRHPHRRHALPRARGERADRGHARLDVRRLGVRDLGGAGHARPR